MNKSQKSAHEKGFFHTKFVNEMKNKIIIENKEEMTTKKKVVKKVSNDYTFTLKEALDFYDTMKNPQGTITIAKNAITNLIFWYKNFNENDTFNTMTNKELMDDDSFTSTDIYELLKDYDKTEEAIENIKIKKTNEPVAVDTKKQVITAIVYLGNSSIKVDKDIFDKYSKLLQDYQEQSNKKRRQNEPTSKELKHLIDIGMNWIKIKQLFQDFEEGASYTNTKTGKRNLKAVCFVGMYVLQIPRRITDYMLLQLWTKQPTEKEQEGKNILYVEKDKSTLYLDVFKTRFITRRGKTKELLPRFVKVIDDKLHSYMKDYIKKFQLKQGDYVFHQDKADTNTQYTSTSSFGDGLTSASKLIFKTSVGANSFRHFYNTWLSDNINEFTDEQLRKISVELGDTERDLPTHLRYRIANRLNKNLTKTEIQNKNEYLQVNFGRVLEEEVADSVGNVPQAEQNEVIVDNDKEILIQNLFNAMRPFLLKLL
jgi:hypothetical protein